MPAEPLMRLADFLPYRLAITSSAVSGVIAGGYRAEFGLAIAEWRVMAVLGDAEPLSQRDLVRATRLDKVAINRACKGLETRGLLERAPNQTDGRSHLCRLTRAGHAIHARIWPQALGIEAAVFAALTADEAAQLRALLDKVLLAADTVGSAEDEPD